MNVVEFRFRPVRHRRGVDVSADDCLLLFADQEGVAKADSYSATARRSAMG